MTKKLKTNHLNLKHLWLGIFFITLIWSGIDPKEYLTWFLEVVPALIGVAVLIFTYRSFPLTPMLYTLILIHCIILMIGGHYTYEHVPVFDWLRNWADGTRNNYDKVGHFVQGFVPFYICREIVIRNKIINRHGWQTFFSISVCLALSALYELIEWWTALAIGGDADAFLSTQGYVWDTQADMATALLGAIIASFTFVRLQDKQLKKL